MNKNKELAKNTLIIFLGKFCTQFVSFLLVPIYTKYLSTSSYGYIDLVQSYITLLVPILILRFDSAVFRFLLDERGNKKGLSNIVSSTFLMLFVQILLFTTLYFIFQSVVGFDYCILIFINVLCLAFSSLILQLVRGLGDNLGYSIASIISGILNLVISILLIVKFNFGASSILISSSIANLVCVILLFFRNKIYRYFKFGDIKLKTLKPMLKYSLPMIPDGLSWWVVNVSDRIIISTFISTAVNGIYAISSKFSNILTSIFQVFNMSWQESASLHINDDDKETFFSDILNTSFQFFFSICILIMVCLPFVFLFLIGKDYSNAYLYVPILLLGNLFNAIANTVGAIYIAQKKTGTVAKTTMLAAFINISINLIFVKQFGLWAAAFSTLIAYICVCFYRYFNIRKVFKIQLNYSLFFKYLFVYFISMTIYYINNIGLSVLNLLIVSFYILLINKAYLGKILVFLKKKK